MNKFKQKQEVRSKKQRLFFVCLLLFFPLLLIVSSALGDDSLDFVSANQVKQDLEKLVNREFYGVYGLKFFVINGQEKQLQDYEIEVQVELLRNEKQFPLPINKTPEEMCSYSYYEELCKPAGTLLKKDLVLKYQKIDMGWVLQDPTTHMLKKIPMDGFVKEQR